MAIIKRMSLVGTKGTKLIDAVIDTGAEGTVINEELSKQVGLPRSGDVSSNQLADGNEVIAKGITILLKYRGRQFQLEGWASPNLPVDCLIGRDFLSANNVKIHAKSGRMYFR